MAILGLMSAEDFTAQREYSIRRRVFYDYPNGNATLTGFLSLCKEESCNDPKYTWFEKRLPPQFSLMTAISTTVVFYSTVNANFSTWTTATGNVTFTRTTNGSTPQYGVKVASTDPFRVNQLVKIDCILVAGGSTDVIGRITNVDTSNLRIAFVVISPTSGAVDYDGVHTTKHIIVVGSAYAEGARSSTEGAYTLPTELSNYTQIFRTPFSFTRTALKTTTRFDDTGVYKDKAKDHSIKHMTEIEKGILFGQKHLFLNSDGMPVRSTQGIIPFLEEWEAGTTYGNEAATANADENKRIIDISGNLTDDTYTEYLERLFRTTSNGSAEKLVLCGNMFLLYVNRLYKNNSVLNSDLPSTDTYGTNVVKHLTPFGTIYYKTHPLFNHHAELRNNALFLDVHNLKYRYLDDSDTTLLKNRQDNDFDGRKDEWLTEAGLEVNLPESHMYIKNVTGVA